MARYEVGDELFLLGDKFREYKGGRFVSACRWNRGVVEVMAYSRGRWEARTVATRFVRPAYGTLGLPALPSEAVKS